MINQAGDCRRYRNRHEQQQSCECWSTTRPFHDALNSTYRSGLNRSFIKKSLKVPGQQLSRFISSNRILFEAFQTDRFNIFGDSFLQPSWAYRII